MSSCGDLDVPTRVSDKNYVHYSRCLSTAECVALWRRALRAAVGPRHVLMCDDHLRNGASHRVGIPLRRPPNG